MKTVSYRYIQTGDESLGYRFPMKDGRVGVTVGAVTNLPAVELHAVLATIHGMDDDRAVRRAVTTLDAGEIGIVTKET